MTNTSQRHSSLHFESRKLGRAAEDFGAAMANMFQFYAEDSERFTGDRDLAKVRELNPGLQSLEEWLTKHKHDFKLEPNL